MQNLHEEGFTHRTKQQVKSLYTKVIDRVDPQHKTYLSLASCSAKDLIAIMQDFYKAERQVIKPEMEETKQQ